MIMPIRKNHRIRNVCLQLVERELFGYNIGILLKNRVDLLRSLRNREINGTVILPIWYLEL